MHCTPKTGECVPCSIYGQMLVRLLASVARPSAVQGATQHGYALCCVLLVVWLLLLRLLLPCRVTASKSAGARGQKRRQEDGDAKSFQRSRAKLVRGHAMAQVELKANELKALSYRTLAAALQDEDMATEVRDGRLSSSGMECLVQTICATSRPGDAYDGHLRTESQRHCARAVGP